MVPPNPADLKSSPEQYQPRRSFRIATVLWLAAIGLAILFLPIYFVSNTVQGDITRLEADLLSVQGTRASLSTLAPEVQELMNTLAQVQEPASEIQEAYPTIVAGRTDWPAIMAAIRNYNPAQLALTSLTHTYNRIILSGQAVDDSAVVAYARALEQSNLFSRVVVQSIKVIATPFATPTSTKEAPPTPTLRITPTGTLTPTLQLMDKYETDDFQPQEIFLGQPQSHNFYPIYDVDKVKFLAKAGRYYRVFTSDLAPGVDTFLTVSLGGATYINDDRQPGALSSEVVFPVVTDRDVEVLVGVTNRGQYGPDKRYQITVEEVVPTPTPIPTDTPIPTGTPTSTPDLRDGYEPDDTDPAPIAVGETQAHNFYPDNDVDRVRFLAKAGRYYRVSTSGLPLGVDTSLTVSVEGTIYANDDRQSGDLSSEVVFQVMTDHDVEALVEVTNRGQYGPDKGYQITVKEVIPTSTSTPTPTIIATSTSTSTPTSTATSTATPTDTPTATASPSSKLPGLATLTSGFVSTAPSRPWLMIAEWADILPLPSTRGDNSPEAVEFVIVLELKAESP